jgi:hypothetical protein
MKKLNVIKSAALTLLIGVTSNVLAAPTYIRLDFPGGIAGEGNDINDFGLIVGDYLDTFGTEHGYLLNGGAFSDITFPGAIETEAYSLNTVGDIVGDYALSTSGGSALLHGYLLRGGTFSSIDFPGSTVTSARGINQHGDIVGIYSHKNQNDTSDHGFLLRNGSFSSIDFPGAAATDAFKINDAGQIAGRYKSATDGGYHVFLLSSNVFTSIPDVPGSIDVVSATKSEVAINNVGDMVGDYSDQTPAFINFRLGSSHGNLSGFLLSGGVYTPINYPGASVTGAFGINSNDYIVGVWLDTNGIPQGYLRVP